MARWRSTRPRRRLGDPTFRAGRHSSFEGLGMVCVRRCLHGVKHVVSPRRPSQSPALTVDGVVEHPSNEREMW